MADLNYPDSKTRRGRVEERGNISPTIAAEAHEVYRIERANMEIDKNKLRIRKLTPRECFRLMDFSDEDFDKAQAVMANTNLYKQAGNSIVRLALVSIFSQMGIQGHKRWNDMTMEEKRALRNINPTHEEEDGGTDAAEEVAEQMDIDKALSVIVANRPLFKGDFAEALDVLVTEMLKKG